MWLLAVFWLFVCVSGAEGPLCGIFLMLSESVHLMLLHNSSVCLCVGTRSQHWKTAKQCSMDGPLEHCIPTLCKNFSTKSIFKSGPQHRLRLNDDTTHLYGWLYWYKCWMCIGWHCKRYIQLTSELPSWMAKKVLWYQLEIKNSCQHFDWMFQSSLGQKWESVTFNLWWCISSVEIVVFVRTSSLLLWSWLSPELWIFARHLQLFTKHSI